MKTIKFILPALAFSFAILASFASVNAESNLLITKRVSLPAPSDCEDVGSCTTGGSTLCQTAGGDIYREFIPSSETCSSSFNGTRN